MSRIKNFFKENVWYIIVFILMILFLYIKIPYYIMLPGGIIDISDKVQLSSGHKLNGSVNMLYASQLDATIPTYLISLISEKWDSFENKERIIGSESLEEVSLREKLLLDNSVDNAIYASYSLLNYPLNITNIRNYVIAKEGDTNCEISVGDELIEINNTNINSINLSEYINSYNVGDILNIKTLNNDKIVNKECSVSLIDDSKKLGIVVIQNIDYEIDGVNINFTGKEGGSSGGFMMALSIYLSLSDEDILKGRTIAGTGTIDSTGNVGEIGGVKYKIIGAYKNNIELVFVPSSNYEEAMYIKNKYKYDDMEIVSVDTLQDAIDYLSLK